MAAIIPFPQKPEDPISVTLTGAEWFAIMVKLSGEGRSYDRAIADRAESKMLQQLKKGR